jgi:hypothetical protein
VRRLRAWARAGLRFWQVPWGERADVLIAFMELARARWRLHRLPAARVLGPGAAPARAPTPAQQASAARVSAAINRAARHAPWRADCLVQALAAQAWLTRRAIPSALQIGAHQGGPAGQLHAHAWLLCGEAVITGGDIAPFRPFTSPAE